MGGDHTNFSNDIYFIIHLDPYCTATWCHTCFNETWWTARKQNHLSILNTIINIIRSLPFIILLFFILPFTKFLMGTSIGVQGVIVPLVVFTAPYIARLMETALLEVDRGVIEAYQAMGVSTIKIIWHVMVKEARPSLVLGLTIATIGLIGATAMAGLVGAGGLGDLAYRFGHLRYEPEVMYATVFILIILVQGLQSLGNGIARRLKKD